jgi:hypothetical protein
MARLGGIVAGPGVRCEYAGVDLGEDKALARRCYQRSWPAATGIFWRGPLIPAS